MEPIILGAGGMLFCDPLFQRCLADVVRSHPELFTANATATNSLGSETTWTGLPIIFDEVFTGLYRLGRKSAASFLNVHPDIAVNAKLLTGGLLPLCTTLASEEIFQAFSSPEKSDALLHGHSYTAHAVGCTVAVDSLRTMTKMESSGSWNAYRDDWKAVDVSGEDNSPEVWSVWSRDLLRDLSYAESVESVFALGTVLSISLRDAQGGGKSSPLCIKIISTDSSRLTCDVVSTTLGYTSTAAKGLQQRLSAGGPRFNVHSRVLGNVLYLMSSITSKPETVRGLEALLRSALL
jgi:dethiobiotin synthetase/adenosylmethionine--8-amino-7-oxononanoate aminotransferase